MSFNILRALLGAFVGAFLATNGVAQKDSTAKPDPLVGESGNRKHMIAAQAAAKPCECEEVKPTICPRIIEFDLGEGCKVVDMSSLENMKRGDQYRVRVKGVNLNLYRVTVNGKDSSSAEAYTFPSFGDFNVDALSALVAGIGSFNSLATASIPDNVLTAVDSSKGTSNQRMSFARDEIKKTGASPATVERASIDKVMDGHKKELEKFLAEMRAIRGRIDDLKLDATLRQLQLQADRGANEIDAALEGRNGTSIKEITDRLMVVRKDIFNQQAYIAQKQAEYLEYALHYKKTIESDDELKAKGAIITEAYAKAATAAETALESINATVTGQILESLSKLATAGDVYTSMPFQYLGGDAAITVDIGPLAEKGTQQRYHTVQHFPLDDRSYGGLSGGFYFSGLHDDAFSVRKTTTPDPGDTTSTSLYTLVDEEPGKVEFGASALFTWGWKGKKNEDWGGHFAIGPGVGITNKIRPRLLFGGGFSVGSMHMLMVNMGGIVGYVERRANVFAGDVEYPEEPKDVTVARIQLSAFLSVGYMFKF